MAKGQQMLDQTSIQKQYLLESCSLPNCLIYLKLHYYLNQVGFYTLRVPMEKIFDFVIDFYEDELDHLTLVI